MKRRLWSLSEKSPCRSRNPAPGDVSRLVLRPSRLDLKAAAVAGTQEDGRLEDADVVVRQMLRQPIGRNEELRVRECHDLLQPI